MQKHTYQSGIVGNCAFIAHVHKNTDISWLCWPRFDSSFVFGSLLDQEKGGSFTILPEGSFTSRQFYVENTNVLCTEVECSEGIYRIIDFAPRFYQYERYYKPLMLVRKIQVMSGNPRVKITCRPTKNYGESELERFVGSNHVQYSGLANPIRLTSNFPLSHIVAGKYSALNETKYLVLTFGTPLEAPLESTAEDFLRKTTVYWQQWVKNTGIGNMYQEQVIRSSLALKIHQFEDTGAIVAASTTSLPEFDQSGRTWDYRFCWLRDAYYILQAFNNIGHFEEMEGYFNYLANISENEKGRYQPLFSISGDANLREREVDLYGYLGNKPVRVGNQASEHIQNDAYGQMLLSLLPLYTDKRFTYSERHDSAKWVENMLLKIENTIDEEDAGIWEFRHIAQRHCYTNLFQWAGCQAAMKIAAHINNIPLEKKAMELADRAAKHIEACYDPVREVYTQAEGTSNLDASTLQLIMMGYLDHRSEKARKHLEAVEDELKAPGGLFYRYKHKDDFGIPETTFLITAFWYVEALACVGRIKEATEAFENLLKYTNHLGLLSEDVLWEDGSQWGNFPQAYSHVGLMNAAYRIAKKIDKPDFLSF
ncbi:glycoside hydrolase family 15 protein [Solitalea canadensis]|uniref:Glycosyl hydrolase, glucoamylase n=1 Tax=Solitalea canadensis (strain ATCC 29591 / DSM 3403 / JCM 21819 / LMG 8368 / NBRC 15130 / NCIMB 12057 / USAM 9D) TaxID=929556 RepID=H8KQW6_SOLCM|nr:glycoside hydrolase family 15 protein [Solitalea canadensis]AFD07112.1 glycosyl hydrolase, glucoamylase [Solitalea canadensis DSM 3403]